MSITENGYGTPVALSDVDYELIATATDLAAFMDTSSYTADQINQALYWVDGVIKDYCKRDFKSTTYREWVEPSTQGIIWLSQYPLQSIQQCYLGINNYIQITYTHATGKFAQAFVSDDQHLVLNSTNAAGNSTTKLDLTAYSTIASVAAAITAVSGWTASALTEGDPLSLRPMSTADVLNLTDYLDGPGSPLRIRNIEKSGRINTFSQGAAGYGTGPYAYVQYTAGYSTIPYGLNSIAVQMARDYLTIATKEINRALKSETIGEYKYEIGEGSKALAETWYSSLDIYRDVEI
jgi:hypothetical protein